MLSNAKVRELRKNANSKGIIVSSSNNIYYIQIHHFTLETMLNQSLYYTIQYLEPNTKYKGMVPPTPLVADVTINSLVAWRLTLPLFVVGSASTKPGSRRMATMLVLYYQCR